MVWYVSGNASSVKTGSLSVKSSTCQSHPHPKFSQINTKYPKHVHPTYLKSMLYHRFPHEKRSKKPDLWLKIHLNQSPQFPQSSRHPKGLVDLVIRALLGVEVTVELQLLQKLGCLFQVGQFLEGDRCLAPVFFQRKASVVARNTSYCYN